MSRTLKRMRRKILTGLSLRGQFLRIVGRSMHPTLQPGQVIFVSTRSYRRRFPRRGEVVVARPASAGGRLMIKRLVGLPHDTIELAGQRWQLNEHEFFLLGDDARASTDSRSFGPVTLKELVGPVPLSLWPWRRVSVS